MGLQDCHPMNTIDGSGQGTDRIVLSRVLVYNSRCNPPLQDICLICTSQDNLNTMIFCCIHAYRTLISRMALVRLYPFIVVLDKTGEVCHWINVLRQTTLLIIVESFRLSIVYKCICVPCLYMFIKKACLGNCKISLSN